MLAIIMLLGSDIKAISLVSSVRTPTHHLELTRDCRRTCDKVQTGLYLTVVICQGEIGEIKHRLKWWLHT